MPNRRTGLDVSAFTTMGSAYLGDLTNFTVRGTNKTAEGKGVAEIDDFPVLTGRSWEASADLLIPTTITSHPLIGTALSGTPAGTIALATGAGSYGGTAVITSWEHRGERDGIQTVAVTLTGRGALGFT